MQLNKLTKEDSKVIDILKCIGILSVISAHVVQYSEVNLITKIVSFFWNQFGHVGVVIFFVIGGFLYSRKDGDDATFWKKKLFRIIIPWMLAAIITYAICVMLGGPLGVYRYLHYLHQVRPQVNSRGGTQHQASIENWIKDLLSVAPPIRTRPSFPLSFLSHQEASISLLSFSIRGQID